MLNRRNVKPKKIRGFDIPTYLNLKILSLLDYRHLILLSQLSRRWYGDIESKDVLINFLKKQFFYDGEFPSAVNNKLDYLSPKLIKNLISNSFFRDMRLVKLKTQLNDRLIDARKSLERHTLMNPDNADNTTSYPVVDVFVFTGPYYFGTYVGGSWTHKVKQKEFEDRIESIQKEILKLDRQINTISTVESEFRISINNN